MPLSWYENKNLRYHWIKPLIFVIARKLLLMKPKGLSFLICTIS